jgi:hypothetical protein
MVGLLFNFYLLLMLECCIIEGLDSKKGYLIINFTLF